MNFRGIFTVNCKLRRARYHPASRSISTILPLFQVRSVIAEMHTDSSRHTTEVKTAGAMVYP